MRMNFQTYVINELKNLKIAVINLFLFFPYFFSVLSLFKTLFSPWKKLIVVQKKNEFSFTHLAEVISFNLISRTIGFVMRICLLSFYMLLQAVYFFLLPFIVVVFMFLLPIRYLSYRFTPSAQEIKERIQKEFTSTHCMDIRNMPAVERWFEWLYAESYELKPWWSSGRLFALPPLARDWAVGFTPTLDEYSEELHSGKYEERKIVDRKKEIALIEQSLGKTSEANAVVIGEEGVGKHAVIDAFAKKISEGSTLTTLAYKRILKLEVEKILSLSTDHAQREEIMNQLCAEAAAATNIILFIENIDQYVGGEVGRIDLSIPLERWGKTNRLQILATTTPFSYQRFILRNEKLHRILTPIEIKEIDTDQAKRIVLGLVPRFEFLHHVTIPYETVLDTVEKSEFYITTIPFPEKAIDLLESTCVSVRMKVSTSDSSLKKIIITPEMVNATLSEKSHIPTQLTDQLKKQLLTLESSLSSKVLFQEDAVGKISAALRRSFILLGKRKKPLASFLLLGPTGVGKTETAKALAELLFGTSSALVRFDMSLYQSKSDIAHLIGSPETQNPGTFSKAIREHPYAVLLLDELEKAHHDLINIFLTLLDEGYITDGFGKRVDCKTMIVIATSNAGSRELLSVPSQQLLSTIVSTGAFSPEFLNRFDGVVLYHSLTENTILSLAHQMVERISKSIYDLYRVHVKVSDITIQDLVHRNFDPAFGARNLERAITQELENTIAKRILNNEAKEETTIEL